MNVSGGTDYGYFCNSTALWYVIFDENHDSEVRAQISAHIDGMNITIEDWLLIRSMQHALKVVKSDLTSCIYILLSCFGIIGSMCNLWLMNTTSYRKHQTFRIYILTISMSDLVFNLCYVPFTYCTSFHGGVFADQPLLTILLIVTIGVVNCSSLFSDFATLALTVERYLCVANPHFWRAKNASWKYRFCLSSLAISAAFTFIRVHTFINIDATSVKGFRRNLTVTVGTSNWTAVQVLESEADNHGTFYKLWVSFSEFFMPLMIMCSMLSLTIAMIVKLRRTRKKVTPTLNVSSDKRFTSRLENPAAVASLSRDEQSGGPAERPMINRHVLLMICLATVSSCTCQWSYITWWFTHFLMSHVLNSTLCRVDIRHLAIFHLYQVSDVLTNLLELIARIDLFYYYCIFSSTFREELKSEARRLCKSSSAPSCIAYSTVAPVARTS